jgi:hypothetical protein
MQISFTFPTQFVGGAALSQAQAEAATYNVQIDTVNPPVVSFAVPAAKVAAAVNNTVSVDAVADLGADLVPGTTYYVSVTDTVSGVTSAQAAVVSYVYNPAPNPPSALKVV